MGGVGLGGEEDGKEGWGVGVNVSVQGHACPRLTGHLICLWKSFSIGGSTLQDGLHVFYR